MKDKTIDLRMSLYQDDLISSINELNNKYDMPLCLSSILVKNILEEINRLSSMELEKHISEYEKEMSKNAKN